MYEMKKISVEQKENIYKILQISAMFKMHLMTIFLLKISNFSICMKNKCSENLVFRMRTYSV